MPDSVHLEHLVVLLLWVHSMRLWWRVNRRWVMRMPLVPAVAWVAFA